MTLAAVRGLITDSKYEIVVLTKEHDYEFIFLDYLGKNIADFSKNMEKIEKYKKAKVWDISTNSATGLLKISCNE